MEIRTYQDSEGRAPFDHWLQAMPDRTARAKIRARLARVEAGNFGDCKPLRDGVQELRIDRVYFSRQGQVLVLLLCGSDKSEQSREITRAIAYLNDWKERGKP